MPISDEEKHTLLNALNRLGTAAGEVELHAETLQDLKTFRKNLKDLENEGLVYRRHEKESDLDNMIGLTVKGLDASR